MRRMIALFAAVVLLFCGCTPASQAPQAESEWLPEHSMELQYATQFSVDYYAGGYKLISLADGSRFLVIPEGKDFPAEAPKDAVPLYQPIENIYLAATSVMCLFDALDALDSIALSGTKEEGWYIENARTAMAEGRMLYAGKYSEPDYEMLLSHRVPLAIESTMIGHASDVKAKLEELGIAVLVDQASNESHPLGRTEWIKLYAALLNCEETAEQLFAEQIDYMNSAVSERLPNASVAFFYISSSGKVVARKSGDYVTKMLELAGGTYVFDALGDPEKRTATVTIEMEQFFAAAKEADYIIYNTTIGGEVSTLRELLEKNPLLAEMKAVQNGNVWCTGKNMYQETTQLGQMTLSFHSIFSGEAAELDTLPYLYRLK